MNTHESYVSLEVAKLLKQAGFDWECIRYYQNNDDTLLGPLVEQYKLVCTNFNVAPIYMDQYSAPTLEVAQRWLREVKHLNISVDYDPTIKQQSYVYFIYDIDDMYGDVFGGISPITHDDSGGYFYTYEEAQETGIKKALEIILEKGE